MPDIEGRSRRRPEQAGDLGLLKAVLIPAGNVAEDFIVFGSTLSVDFFIEDGLFAEMGEGRVVEIEAG